MVTHLLRFVMGLILLTSTSAFAGENLWVYTKGTDTRPDGTWELKLNSISRIDKDSGSYVFHDIRPEIEYGITDSLTVAGAVMIFSHDYDGIEPGNDPVHETQEANGGSFDRTQYGGFEIKVKYNVLSPYKDPLGLSLGFAYERRNQYRLDGADINQDSFVPMLFLQKNFLDDTLVFALFSKMELERRKSPGVLEEEIAFDVAAGVSYRFAPKWYIGAEFRHQSDYLCVEEDDGTGHFVPEPGVECSEFDLTDFNIGRQFQNGNYFGPSLHYGEERWYATVGALYQIGGGGANSNGGSFQKDGRNFDEHEKWHVGFSFGYNF